MILGPEAALRLHDVVEEPGRCGRVAARNERRDARGFIRPRPPHFHSNSIPSHLASASISVQLQSRLSAITDDESGILIELLEVALQRHNHLYKDG
jgi:hypothetical protein